MAPLPPLVPFPASAAERQQIPPAQWTAAVHAWLALVQAHLALSDAVFASASLPDESLPPFLAAVVASAAAAAGPANTESTDDDDALRQGCFMLLARVLRSETPPPPPPLLQWDFLADFCRAYGRRRAAAVLAGLSAASVEAAEASLSHLKKQLVQMITVGAQRDVAAIEDRLRRVNPLVGAWPPAGALLLAGNDFLDALVACFRVTHPPLRRALVTTVYLGLVGQTDGAQPRYALLSDTLYALRSAAEEHRQGPLGARDSLVAELVTVTPLLGQLQRRIEAAGASAPAGRIAPVLRDLAQYRNPQSGMAAAVPARRLARRHAHAHAHAHADKGKQVAASSAGPGDHTLHAHTLRKITQVQDLFPDLGSAFVAKLLDAYDDDPEQVVAHLLEGTLPAHLAAADQTENLSTTTTTTTHAFTPRATPQISPPASPPLPDDDGVDGLAADAAQLHFGKHASARTADDALRDRAARPAKAAILAALAAFDSDDDERDDTYDAEDVGGTVDAPAEEDELVVDIGGEANEQALFAAYNATPAVFGPDLPARRSAARARLRETTGLADDVIEAWGRMLAHSPQQRWRLAATYWDNSTAGGRGRGRGRGGNRGGGRGGGGRGGGRGGGNVAGKPHDAGTEEARRRKEAHKGSRANHNRRDQRARKMGRGFGGPS